MPLKRSPIWSPIGLDIGRRQVRAIQLAGSPQKPQLGALLMMDRLHPDEPFGTDEAVRLRQVLDRRGFTGNQVVPAVPPEQAMTVVMDLPPRASGAPLNQIAGAELARVHRRSPDGLEVTFWDLPRPAGKKIEGEHVMVAACDHQEADRILDVIEGQGFSVFAMDMQCWALVRACRPIIISHRGIIAIVNISWSAVTFSLLHSGVLVYERQLSGCDPAGLIEPVARDYRLDRQVVEYLLFEFGLGEGSGVGSKYAGLYDRFHGQVEAHYESFAQELRLSMSYAEHQYPDDMVSLVLLTGFGASVPGLPDYFTQAIETETRAVRLLDLINCRQASVAEMQSTALTTAIGLAMYDEGGGY